MLAPFEGMRYCETTETKSDKIVCSGLIMVKKPGTKTQSDRKEDNSDKGEPAFPCFRCGICCSGYQIYMSLDEARIIAEKIGMTLDIFANYYLDPRWPDRETIVVRNIASRCPFLDKTEGSIFGLCRIHECKPLCCRQWQASPMRKECRLGLSYYWDISVSEDGKLTGFPEDLLCFQTFIDSLSEEEES